MTRYGDFTVQRWSHLPWVAVWDPLGVQDEGCHTFLTFWAWQDVPPQRLRRWARHLAEAWTWLRMMDYDWPSAPLEVWTHWATCQLAVPVSVSALAPRVETLYRFYAFWHWYDPQRVPQQPWPRDPRERARWLSLIANP